MKILEIIEQIERDKKCKNIVPSHALVNEILRKTFELGISPEIVWEELDKLLRANKIVTGNTINDNYISII